MKAKVLIILPTDKHLHRKILEGILAYGREHGPWQFHFETGDRYEQTLGKGCRWGCTGVIALVREPSQLSAMLATKLPAVFINPPAGRLRKRPPVWATYVNRNQADVGKTAAEYFLDRRYRHFAFVGTPAANDWCERRLEGFRARLEKEGFGCNVYPGPPADTSNEFDREAGHLSRWLRALPPDTALFAVRDRRALQVLGLCQDAGITVPDTLAVLGTDDDEVLCESVSPTLSSIALDGINAGMLCAQLLDRHLHGRSVEPLVDLAFPRVVTRQSTDATKVGDAYVAKALARVRTDLRDVKTVAELAAELGISKRSLEMKASVTLGTTLKEEITRIRINEAVRLISNTGLSLQAVAERCGFCCGSHMTARFKAVLGYNPSVFRYQEPGDSIPTTPFADSNTRSVKASPS